MAKKKTKTTRAKSAKAGRTTKPKATKKATKAAKPKRRKVARQTRLPGTEDPNADPTLDEMVVSAYELTLTFQAAQKEMNGARDKLQHTMQGKGIELYETHDGYIAKFKRGKDKVTISAADASKTVELEAD